MQLFTIFFARFLARFEKSSYLCIRFSELRFYMKQNKTAVTTAEKERVL